MSAKMTAILAILLACAIENSQPDNKLSRDFNTASTGDHLSPQTQQFKRRFGISACHQVSKTWALKTRRYQDAFATIWDYEYMDEGLALLLFEKKLPDGFDKNVAKELLRALDYMPLAISQAAAYISQRAPRTTVAKYLDTFRKSDTTKTNLLNTYTEDLRRDRSASNSIITTWQISFEYIRDKSPSAARLLSLMSFFDRQGIPKYLLHHYDDGKDGSDIDLEDNSDADLENDGKDGSDIDLEDTADADLEDDADMAFENDVFVLNSYSLIKSNIENDHFEMHRLVQFSTRKWLELNCELEKWKKKYIMILHKAFPTGYNYENWTTCRVLFPHVEAALACRPKGKKYLLYWCKILSNAGQYADVQGNLLTAEKIERRALEGRMKVLGKEHPDTLTSVSNLALVLDDQGKHEAAEEMNWRALDGREKTLGKEHVDTLTSVSNLATVLHSQRKYGAAEEFSRRAVDGREKILGKEHIDTLTSVNNLATVLQDQGNYQAAEELNWRALNGRMTALGKEHPDTLLSIGNLALVLHDQGKYGSAEELNWIALDSREKALGKEHPHTLTNVINLALVLKDQKNYEAADELYRRALDGFEKVLGKEHPNTLTSVHNLVISLRQQKRYEDAIPLYKRLLASRQNSHGANDPRTLRCFDEYVSMIEEMNEPNRESSSSRQGENAASSVFSEPPHFGQSSRRVSI